MAQGDVIWFDQAMVDVQLKLHDLDTDVLKIGFVDSVTTPTTATADPRWGAGGTVNFSTNEVSETSGNYTAGGETIATPTVTLSAGAAVLDAADLTTIAQHASNPTAARWGIAYNSTDAGKRCLFSVDFGADTDMTNGDFDLAWNISGITSTDQV
ncbi:MAG: hypothetical protein OES09_00130 [Gammaproteobacteria bacterium]|nr:hypothetical protein [Gammaproteobacteria bacterium]